MVVWHSPCESRTLPGTQLGRKTSRREEETTSQANNLDIRLNRISHKLCADMAQLVERTLGKGEVPSSTLGISTTLKKPRFGGVFVVIPKPPPMEVVNAQSG